MKPSQDYLEKLKNSENRNRNPRIHDPKRQDGGFDPTIGYGYSLNGNMRKLEQVNADFKKVGIPPLSATEWNSIQRGEYHRIDRSLSEVQMSALLDVTVDDYAKGMEQAAAARGIDIKAMPQAVQDVAFDQYYNGGGKLIFSDKSPSSNAALKNGDYGTFLGEVLLNSNKTGDDGLYNRRIDAVQHALAGLPDPEREKAQQGLQDYIESNPDLQKKLENSYRKEGKTPPDLSIIGGALHSTEPRLEQKTQPVGSASDVNPTTVPKASILDYLNKGLGQIGEAISTVGHVAFDTALGLGKETLTQTIRLALAQGNGGKAMLKQAAQLAVGNMLASMHAQVVQQAAQQAGWPTGIAGPLQRPTKPVEQVMNDPRNQSVFERMAREVQRLLGIYPDLDPAIIMADQGLKHIRQGDIKIPQGILLPDMLPMDKPKGSEPRIDILGVPLPVGWPEIGVIHENPNAHPSAAGQPTDLFAFRDGDGVVQVASYSRGGITVKAHSRSKPDGDVTNNLSYKFKV